MANHTIMAVMLPWVMMYDRAMDVPWMVARIAESFGLNCSPIVSPPVIVCFPRVRSLL
jgi:hypothetical protein